MIREIVREIVRENSRENCRENSREILKMCRENSANFRAKNARPTKLNKLRGVSLFLFVAIFFGR